MIETIHIVPVMSKFETEPDMASASQCRRRPPRKYASRLRDAARRNRNPAPTTRAKYAAIVTRSIRLKSRVLPDSFVRCFGPVSYVNSQEFSPIPVLSS
jgi:hypothetical protein